MTTRSILESIVALSASRPKDEEIRALAALAKTQLEIDPTVFVTMYDGRVKDVASDSTEVVCYVIDEDRTDDQAVEATIDTEDGGSYTAGVKKMAVTPVHFDKHQVVEAGEGNAYANGTRL